MGAESQAGLDGSKVHGEKSLVSIKTVSNRTVHGGIGCSVPHSWKCVSRGRMTTWQDMEERCKPEETGPDGRTSPALCE